MNNNNQLCPTRQPHLKVFMTVMAKVVDFLFSSLGPSFIFFNQQCFCVAKEKWNQLPYHFINPTCILLKTKKRKTYVARKIKLFHKILPNSSKNHPCGKTRTKFQYHTLEKPFNIKTNAWTKTACSTKTVIGDTIAAQVSLKTEKINGKIKHGRVAIELNL